MSATEEDVLSALVNLGYQRAAARKGSAAVSDEKWQNRIVRRPVSRGFVLRFRNSYLPMQNVLKIRFRMSSVVVAPVIASSGRSALYRSISNISCGTFP